MSAQLSEVITDQLTKGGPFQTLHNILVNIELSVLAVLIFKILMVL